MKDRQQVVKIIAFFAGFIIAAGLIAAIPKSWYLQAGGVETDLLSDYVDQKTQYAILVKPRGCNLTLSNSFAKVQTVEVDSLGNDAYLIVLSKFEHDNLVSKYYHRDDKLLLRKVREIGSNLLSHFAEAFHNAKISILPLQCN